MSFETGVCGAILRQLMFLAASSFHDVIPLIVKLFPSQQLFFTVSARRGRSPCGPALASFRWQFVTGSKRCGKEVKKKACPSNEQFSRIGGSELAVK
jgi:hypothetical protein